MADEPPKAIRKPTIKRLSPEEKEAREQERKQREYERQQAELTRIAEYTGGRRALAETIGERQLRLLREKEAIRRERDRERATKQEQQALQKQQEKQQRLAMKEREEQLLNIVPSAFTGQKYVSNAPRQEAISMEGYRKRQERRIKSMFPEEPAGRSEWLVNYKPLKPSALDIQEKEKRQKSINAKRKATLSGQPFVPVYNS
jgi:hypothetical protein